MKGSDHVVLPHHRPAATMWGRGGKDYDEVSFASQTRSRMPRRD
jgi:hypothetical protein